MNKYCFFALAIFLAFAAYPAFSQSAGEFYLGGGVHYAIEDFDLETDGEPGAPEFDFDDSWGMNLRAGYFLHENIAVEGLFQYHFGFSWDESLAMEEPINGGIIRERGRLDADLSAMDFTVNLRAVLPVERFRPYAVAGLGFIRGEMEMDLDIEAELIVDGEVIDRFAASQSESESETELMARFGLGCDFLLSDSWGINGEFAYNMPFGDLDEIRFYTLGVGAFYRF